MRFCIVGGTGFVINLIILIALKNALKAPVEVAQFVGAEVALFSNFILHHHWTYKSKKVNKTMTKLIIQFHATTWPAIIGSTLMVTAGEKLLHVSDLLALSISSIISLAWNFVWSKYVVWKGVTTTELERIAE